MRGVQSEGTTQNEMLPPLLSAAPSVAVPPAAARRNAITLKLLFIAGLVLVLQAPLHLINSLQEERRANNGDTMLAAADSRATPSSPRGVGLAVGDKFEPYRIVQRALKHSAWVLSLVF